MINNLFANERTKNKLTKLRKNIEYKLGKNLDNSLFINLIDYISIDMQYFIDVINTEEQLSDLVYNGYNIIDEQDVYCICRQNAICVNDDNCIIGYKQNGKSLSKSKIINLQTDTILVIYYTDKGYKKSNKSPIYGRSARIVIFSNPNAPEFEDREG